MTPRWWQEAARSSSLSASSSFLIGTMTSRLPWKFHSSSRATIAVLGLRVPIKRDSRLGSSTERGQVLKLLGSAASALRKALLQPDHEARRDRPLCRPAGGRPLPSRTLCTNGLGPPHRLLLLVHPAAASSSLRDRLLRDQQPLLPASCGIPDQKGQASLCQP